MARTTPPPSAAPRSRPSLRPTLRRARSAAHRRAWLPRGLPHKSALAMRTSLARAQVLFRRCRPLPVPMATALPGLRPPPPFAAAGLCPVEGGQAGGAVLGQPLGQGPAGCARPPHVCTPRHPAPLRRAPHLPAPRSGRLPGARPLSQLLPRAAHVAPPAARRLAHRVQRHGERRHRAPHGHPQRRGGPQVPPPRQRAGAERGRVSRRVGGALCRRRGLQGPTQRAAACAKERAAGTRAPVNRRLLAAFTPPPHPPLLAPVAPGAATSGSTTSCTAGSWR